MASFVKLFNVLFHTARTLVLHLQVRGTYKKQLSLLIVLKEAQYKKEMNLLFLLILINNIIY